MNGSGSRQETALRQVLRLVDLSRDLDRNREDSIFSQGGGEIVYVLDENIFEIFIRPFRHSESVETFYGDIWSVTGQADASWHSFESQAALIASEFLLSRSLPGSKAGIILMTEPHRWELAQRVEDLTQEFRKVLQQDEQRIKAELSKKFTALTNLVANDARSIAAPNIDDDRILSQDLAKLRRAGKSEAAVNRIRAARGAADVLANDDTTEPLDQLRRVVTPPIRSKLRTVRVDYQPTADEEKAIEADAHDWFERLVKELSRPGHKSRLRAQNAMTKAVWNDARSVAFLLWLSRNRLKPNQRLAFVTGDALLFDAYRRWHSLEGQNSPASNELFVMRRATQYSPIFNPNDIGGDLSVTDPLFRTNLFSLIQQAVEASLLPFTLSLSSRDPRGQKANRERLALKAIDLETLSEDEELATFSALISDEWLLSHDKRIGAIRDLWQETQRIAIGSSYELISSRLSNEQREIVSSMIKSKGDEAGPLLSDYAAKLLDRLLDDSIELWLPLAEEFLLNQSISSAKRFTPIVSLEDALAKDERSFGPLSPRSAQLVFAKAALHALQLQDTSNATRFSGLALRSGEARSQGDGPRALDLELQYLAGVSHTVDIGSFGEHLRPRATAVVRARSLQRVKQSYARASTFLHNCLSNHFLAISEPTTEHGVFDAVRYLRALSERAALNLFMAASTGLPVGDEGPKHGSDAGNYLRIAKGDLLICARLGRSVVDGGGLPEAIRRQYLINAAAAEVLAFIFSDQGQYRFDERFNQLVRPIEGLADVTKEPHALLIAELTAFFYLAGRAKPNAFSADRFRKRDIWQEAAHLRLPLDRALFVAIQKHVIGAETRFPR
jgi:hypothetical protein